MLKCSCGSTIPRSMCEKDVDGKLICPVCHKVEESAPIKISLKKDDGNEVEVPVPVQTVDGNTTVPNADGIIDALDSGLKSVFGDSVTACPDCGKIICICSLKSFFGGFNKK